MPPVFNVEATQTTGATFQINNAKLYVPVATLSINDNIKFLKKKTKKKKKKNLDNLIDATFRNISRLFVLSFKNDND